MLGDRLAEPEAEGESDLDPEAEGEAEALGLRLAEPLADGLSEALGLRLADADTPPAAYVTTSLGRLASVAPSLVVNRFLEFDVVSETLITQWPRLVAVPAYHA